MKCLLDKMDFDDIKISYIGEEEATDDVDNNNEDLNEDYEPSQERKSEARISTGRRILISIMRGFGRKLY